MAIPMIENYTKMRQLIQAYRFLCEPKNEKLKEMIANEKYETDEVKAFAEKYKCPLAELTLYIKDENAITAPYIDRINENIHNFFSHYSYWASDYDMRLEATQLCEELLLKMASYIILLDMKLDIQETDVKSMVGKAVDCTLNIISKFNMQDDYGYDALSTSYLFDISENLEVSAKKGKIYLRETSLDKEFNTILKMLEVIKEDKITVTRAKFYTMYDIKENWQKFMYGRNQGRHKFQGLLGIYEQSENVDEKSFYSLEVYSPEGLEIDPCTIEVIERNRYNEED